VTFRELARRHFKRSIAFAFWRLQAILTSDSLALAGLRGKLKYALISSSIFMARQPKFYFFFAAPPIGSPAAHASRIFCRHPQLSVYGSKQLDAV
jgi:hypothetical protein